MEYTEQDDQNLVEYVAEKIPYSEAGGRLGNNLYLELEKNVRPQFASAGSDSPRERKSHYSSLFILTFHASIYLTHRRLSTIP